MKYEPDNAKGRLTCSKKMLGWFDMTLTFDLKTLFKATANTLTKGTLWAKYET